MPRSSTRLTARLASLAIAGLLLAGPTAAHATPRHDFTERRAATTERIAERRAVIAARILVAGTVTAVDTEARTVTIAVHAGRPLDLKDTTTTFTVTVDALVVRHEAVVTLDVLQVGDAVIAAGTQTPEGPVVDRVHVPTPEPEPTPDPDPVVDPEPTPEPDPVVDPDPTPEPDPVVDPEPTPDPDPVIDPTV